MPFFFFRLDITRLHTSRLQPSQHQVLNRQGNSKGYGSLPIRSNQHHYFHTTVVIIFCLLASILGVRPVSGFVTVRPETNAVG